MPKQRFDRTVHRARSLVDLYVQLTDDQNYERVNQDILRSAVVFSVSGMDNYFTHKFCTIIVPFLRNNTPSNDLVEFMSKAGINYRFLLHLLAENNDRPLRTIRNKIDNHASKTVTQNFKNIDKLYSLIGLKRLTDNTFQRIGRARTRGGLETLIGRRHQIVHESDYNRHNRTRNIDPVWISARLDYLEIFIENVDFIIQNYERQL